MYKNLSHTEESAMFNAWWKYRQEYYEPETEKEFEAQIIAGEVFVKTYKETPLEELARKLVLLHEEDTEIRLRGHGKDIKPKEAPAHVADESMADKSASISSKIPIPTPVKKEEIR